MLNDVCTLQPLLSFSYCRCYHLLMFHQQCHYCSCLLLCVIHYCSPGWCCGTLLYCEEEMWLPEVLYSDNSSQAAAATTSTSVWWHCWSGSEHWAEGECRIWSCAAVNHHNKVLLIRCFMCIEWAIAISWSQCTHSISTIWRVGADTGFYRLPVLNTSYLHVQFGGQCNLIAIYHIAL